MSERRHTPFAWGKESDIAATAAQLLADGAIIGWFTGGSELGPRALGQRSILADPRSIETKQALNDRIKKREPFRPFAPAVLAEHATDWFELAGPSPYMLLAPAVRPGVAEKVPAVVHVDQTARVQTVHAADLLRHFHALTGIPMVLNTSFNDNEPIVESPADALATFQATELDALCIGDYLVTKA
ncbi:carbamoyltransferase C-terminal domain-containing protein [Sphaerisporangium sp. NPDC051017]|uniref:carbamoyltransferase C-terminal domain-containing protein n=1 Tax=Sphaerisporangium sp. NPDC051017 TaxID=3154636 RepID=UPI00343BE31D